MGVPQQLGGTLTLSDGSRWYLSRTGAGHSGVAHIYRPDKPGTKGRGIPAPSADELQSIVWEARQHHAELRRRVHQALRIPSWESLTLAQMAEVHDTFAAAQSNLTQLNRARRIDPLVGRLIPCASSWVKQLGYQGKELARFQQEHLGLQPSRGRHGR